MFESCVKEFGFNITSHDHDDGIVDGKDLRRMKMM
jgi:hypothetical protein